MKKKISIFSREVREEDVERMLDENDAREEAKALAREEEVVVLAALQAADYDAGNEVPQDAEPLVESEATAATAANDFATRIIADDTMELALLVVGRYWGARGRKMFTAWMRGEREGTKTVGRMILAVKAELGFAPKGSGVTNMRPGKWRRMVLGEAKPANPEYRIKILEEERSLPLGALHIHIKEKYGYEVSRSTAWYAKKRGYFMKPGWRHSAVGGYNKKILLTEEEKRLPVWALAVRRGITRLTASRAQEKGFFCVPWRNGGGMVLDPPPLTEEERLLAWMPRVVTEIGGKPISKFSPRALMETLGLENLEAARRAVKTGKMEFPRNMSRKSWMKFARRLKELSKDGLA